MGIRFKSKELRIPNIIYSQIGGICILHRSYKYKFQIHSELVTLKITFKITIG